MGRGRLRRGCSLEVIFEEDPDFCSYLDSLDGGVAIRFGIKEPEDAISLDSLLEVEEYRVRFQDPADAEQVFRSLDGFIDVRNMDNCMVEWDEFSMDSDRLGEEDTGNGTATTENKDSLQNNIGGMEGGGGAMSSKPEMERPPSGRRSRVSRRQIIQATWLGYSSSSSDESLVNKTDPDGDPDSNNNSQATTNTNKPPRRSKTKGTIPPSSSSKTKTDSDHSSIPPDGPPSISISAPDHPDDLDQPPTSLTSLNSSTSTLKSSGGGGRPSPPNLVTSVEDFPPSSHRLKTPIQLHLRSSPNQSPPKHNAIFGRGPTLPSSLGGCSGGGESSSLLLDPLMMEKDTLDSYISTMTDETDAAAYTFADNFDDSHSVASTNYESSGSTSSTESAGSSVCTVNSFSTQNGGRAGSGGGKSSGNEGKTNLAGTTPSPNNNNTSSKSDGGGSKYKTNLKLELVSQMNRSSQEGRRMMANPQLGVSVSTSGDGGGGPHYSHLSLECPASKETAHEQQQQRQGGGGAGGGGEVKRVRALFELRNHHSPSAASPRSSRSGSSSNGSTCPSSPESTSRSKGANTTKIDIVNNSGGSGSGGDSSTSPTGSASGRLYSKNGRRSKGSPQLIRGSSAASPSKVLRSSPTPLGSNQDLGDLMINQNVVIEDSPDIYQALRSRRNGSNYDRDSVPSPPISNKRPLTLMNLSPASGSGNGRSHHHHPPPPNITNSSSCISPSGSLRRSQSMGTGISSVGGSPPTSVSPVLKESSSKTNILAEELPAPGSVKSVRSVFENMLKMRGKKNSQSQSSVVDASAMNTITPGAFSGSFSIVKKSLSYIRSNPTSKIYRSESMRDDFPSMGGGRRFGKPVLLSEQNSPIHSPGYPSPSSTWLGQAQTSSSGQVASSSSSPTLSTVTETVVDGRIGGGGSGVRSKIRSSSTSPTNKTKNTTTPSPKISPKVNTELSPSAVPSMLRSYASTQAPLTEEDPSFSSFIANERMIEEDYRTRRYVQTDVLQKIREAGTTTTYFGGRIVAKTVKNRKIPVARRHTFDFQDYVGIGDSSTLSSSCQPNYDSYTPSNNYYREGESDYPIHHHGGFSHNPASARRDSYSTRPALEIPLKSSVASIYDSRPNPATISSALDSIFSGGVGLLTFASSKPIDTTPRIISVHHKTPPGSQTGSPAKSCSPVGSILEEGRNSPEGCEASASTIAMEQDGNNNNLPLMPRKQTDTASGPRPACTGEGGGEAEGFNKKFSQITEGAWF